MEREREREREREIPQAKNPWVFQIGELYLGEGAKLVVATAP